MHAHMVAQLAAGGPWLSRRLQACRRAPVHRQFETAPLSAGAMHGLLLRYSCLPPRPAGRPAPAYAEHACVCRQRVFWPLCSAHGQSLSVRRPRRLRSDPAHGPRRARQGARDVAEARDAHEAAVDRARGACLLEPAAAGAARALAGALQAVLDFRTALRACRRATRARRRGACRSRREALPASAAVHVCRAHVRAQRGASGFLARQRLPTLLSQPCRGACLSRDSERRRLLRVPSPTRLCMLTWEAGRCLGAAHGHSSGRWPRPPHSQQHGSKPGALHGRRLIRI